jgi:hypothetical protein
LPKCFIDRPAFTEAAYAATKAGLYGACLNVADAGADGAFASVPSFFAWLGGHWIGVALAAYFAITRGQDAHAKAKIASRAP